MTLGLNTRPQAHRYGLKIIVIGPEGHGKSFAASAIRDLMNDMGADVEYRDHDHSEDNGRYEHTMQEAAARCPEYPLAQTLVDLKTMYPE